MRMPRNLLVVGRRAGNAKWKEIFQDAGDHLSDEVGLVSLSLSLMRVSLSFASMLIEGPSQLLLDDARWQNG